MTEVLDQAHAAPPIPLSAAAAPVEVRRFPYPFRAMLSICSDLDETPGAQTYFDLMRFLNTTSETSFGPGVGLEVGNTIYFDMPPGHFSYWSVDDVTRERIRAHIRSGHIDSLHSFGDLATTRLHAAKALDDLARHDCRLKVWIDHAIAPTNLGKDIMRGHGDEPGHPAYHSDLTTQYGIEFVWRGRVSSVIGQDQPTTFAGIWNARHPLASAKTVAKEIAKHFLATTKPNGKYGLHHGNPLLRPVQLSCGANVHEFLRANPHWAGVSCCDTGWGVQEVFTEGFLQRLVQRNAASIVYTHLGKLRQHDGKPNLEPGGRAAFAGIAERKAKGEVLVTTTHRLLAYHRMRDHAKLTASGDRIDVQTKEPLSNLQGLTCYVQDASAAELYVNGGPIAVQKNPVDETGSPSVSIPWLPLSFPE